MSLRDEHLQQALKHAPDNGLEPSNVVREKVLDYAGKVVKPRRESWLKRTMNLLDSWQLAGMGSVAVALLVVVMVREQLPDESMWNVAEVKDVAQGDVAQGKVESPAASAPQQDKLEARQDAPVNYSDAIAAVSAEKEMIARADRAQAKAKTSLPEDTKALEKLTEKTEIPSASPQMADKDNVAVAAAPVVAAPPEKKLAAAALPATVPASEAASVASTEQKNKLERPAVGETTAGSAARAKVQSVDAVAKPSLFGKKTSMLDEAKASGIAKANKDIQAGVLRILHLGDDWPTGKPLVDEVTGYRVELLTATTMTPAELEAYNQTMRDWYRAQH